MKFLTEKKYKIRICFVIIIVIFCAGAFYFGIQRNMTSVSAGKEETYREYMANELEEMLTSSKTILSCNVDFEVDNNAITKVYLTLDCAQRLSSETEDKIKGNVAGVMNLSADDISISY